MLFVIDGLGDKAYKKLNNKTPLEYASTPNLDFLARHSKLGLMYSIAKGIAPESDQAMISMLGNDVFKCYTGRGILEALGSGIKILPNKTYIRCNFCVQKKGVITEIEAQIKEKKVKELCKKLDRIVPKTRFFHAKGYRAILVVDNKHSNITNTHPGYRIFKKKVTTALPIAGRKLKVKKCKALDKQSRETAKIVNKFIAKASEILAKEEANFIITRGASSRLPKLKALLSWCSITEMPVEIAISKLSKMKVVKMSNNVVKDIKKALAKHSVYVQIKGPDAFAHRGNILGKVKAIEKIDKLIGKLLDMVEKTRFVVTADHSTCCDLRAHCKKPVPLMVTSAKPDNIASFSERSCKKGSLGVILGMGLLKV